MLPCALLCLLAACSGPTLTMRVEPSGANLFVDGRLHPAGEAPFRYYGDVGMQVEPQLEERGEFRYLGVERLVEVAEPVTPWIFPLDFLVELVSRSWAGVDHQTVELALVENPSVVVPGLEPEGAEDVRARSARARISR